MSLFEQVPKDYQTRLLRWRWKNAAAAAAAKPLQSRPTLCDPIDGSPPGFSVPGILQARTPKRVPSPGSLLQMQIPIPSPSCRCPTFLPAPPRPQGKRAGDALDPLI